MKDFKDLDISWSKILKILGVGLLGIIFLSLFINLIVSPIFRSSSSSEYVGYKSYSPTSYGQSVEKASDLSLRNAIGSSPEYNYGEGDLTEEDFEIKDYNATIETYSLDKTCETIANLKPRQDVIFESASKGDESCNYSFKVKTESADEVLAIIEDLDPRDLSENVQTIKTRIDDYTSQEQILLNKQKSVEETLENAMQAYNEITKLATQANDVASLAKVIDSKINTIERLTQERIRISEQLDIISRAKAKQLDRLKYTYFNINVYENKIFDFEYIKDSWINSAKKFVIDINNIFQDLTIRLITLVFSTFRYLVYIFLILIVMKYCWRWGKRIWLGKK